MSSRAEEKERRRRERLEREQQASQAKRRKQLVALVLAVVVLVGATAGVVFAVTGGDKKSTSGGSGGGNVNGQPTSSDPFAPGVPFAKGAGAQGKPVDGIQCLGTEQLAFHIHTHMDVFVNGEPVAIPANIGILGQCLYWLHSHDPSGVVHAESPKPGTYTLGNYFDIWGAPLSSKKMLSWDITNKQPLAIYINGKKYTGNPRDIAIKDHEQVTFVIGKPPQSIPKSYDFSNV